jgi:hypothetical protein
MRASRAIRPLIGILFAACYRYTPATSVTPLNGSVVRLQLTETGAQSMSRVLGRNAIAVDGTILSADDTSFAVSVAATRQREEQPLTWAGERVIVPRSAVQSIEARSLDRKKTFMIVGLGILGAIAIKAIISGLDAMAGGDDGGVTPTPP